MRWVADALTYARVALTLATYPFALTRHAPAFAVLVIVIVMTDMLDGPIARRYAVRRATKSTTPGGTDVRGADLDSASDFLFYASLPIWVYAFRPDEVLEILPFVIGFFILYSIANVLSRLRRGVIGFHNAWTRLAASFGVFFAVWMVLWGLDPLLFWAGITFMTLDLVQRFAGILRHPRSATPAAASAASGRAERDE